MKYLDLLKQVGTEAGKEKLLEHNAKQAKLLLQSQLLATEQGLSDAEQNLTKAKSTYPLDVKSIVELTCTVEDWKRGLEIIKNLETELF